MDRLLTEAKSTKTYLDIAANGNGAEKAMLAIEAARRLFEQEGSSRVHLVEVGPGGGSSITALANAIDNGLYKEGQSMHVSSLEIDGIESDSLSKANRLLESMGSTTSFHRGNITKISETFEDTVDIISTSSVLHEVYSYDGGYTAVNDAIEGIAKQLRPGGFYAYRDIYGTSSLSLHERTRHVYDRSAWVAFSKLFLEHYLNNATHPYHRYEDEIRLSQDGESLKIDEVKPSLSLSIDAPVGLLREVQRHYITLRDHLWREGALGLVPKLDGPEATDWIDRRRGHKRVHYTMLRDDPVIESVSAKNGADDTYVVDGDIFNETTETLMGEFLNDIIECGESSPRWQVWHNWLTREGGETYCYMSLNNLLGNLAIRSYEATEGASILLPTSNSDVIIAPRDYYNRYLGSKLSNPLPDGKQLVLFESIPLKDSAGQKHNELIAQKVTGALGALSVYCSQETLATIYSPLRKALR